MSNVLLESASSGRVLITTDNPGCRETVENGVSGFIYHGGNVDELVEKMEKVLKVDNSGRQKMGEIGRKRVSIRFSRQTVIEAYLKEITIIGGGKGV
jgi:galacturonosyltransferase